MTQSPPSSSSAPLKRPLKYGTVYLAADDATSFDDDAASSRPVQRLADKVLKTDGPGVLLDAGGAPLTGVCPRTARVRRSS
jgi:hypothetical protein